MSQIETTYLDQRIVYAENEDVWRCWALDIEAPTLSALKEKIRKVDADARRMDRPALHFEYNGTKPTLCTIVMLDAERDKVWITKKEGGTLRRHKVTLDRIVLDTPENRALIAEFQALAREAEAARAKSDAARAKIPSPTRDELVGVEAAEPREPAWKRRRRR